MKDIQELIDEFKANMPHPRDVPDKAGRIATLAEAIETGKGWVRAAKSFTFLGREVLPGDRFSIGEILETPNGLKMLKIRTDPYFLLEKDIAPEFEAKKKFMAGPFTDATASWQIQVDRVKRAETRRDLAEAELEKARTNLVDVMKDYLPAEEKLREVIVNSPYYDDGKEN